LSIKIAQQDHTIIIGTSGSGKSSVLRLLAKLWPLTNGTIRRPFVQYGSNSPPVMFLPQTPYMIYGTLRQQIYYPDASSNQSDDMLFKILRSVNLAYLAERLDGFDQVKEWGTVLSPGEQQRLGFARLMYHNVKFAVLDESTSALDLESEEIVYKACLERGMTLISVGHRDTLFAHHKYVLKLHGHTNGCGYTLYEQKQ